MNTKANHVTFHDLAAIAAMQGLLAGSSEESATVYGGFASADKLASIAFEIASAMLRERDQWAEEDEE